MNKITAGSAGSSELTMTEGAENHQAGAPSPGRPTIANRMVQLLGRTMLQAMGYRIRFENSISKNSRIKVVTEGINASLIHSDVAIALAREAQQTLRPDMGLMVMSATLNMPQLTQLLNAPVAQGPDRLANA